MFVEKIVSLFLNFKLKISKLFNFKFKLFLISNFLSSFLAFLKEHFIFKNSLTILTTLFPSMLDLGSLIFF